jgi:hypothetical protein
VATAETRMLEHLSEVLVPAESLGTALTDATIGAALSLIGSSRRTLLIGPGAWTIANNLTIPANVRFVRAPDATITINSARTLTLNGPYELHGTGGFAGAGGVRINYTGRPIPVAEIATGGAGTQVSPWTGFVPTLNALPTECAIHMQAGWYRGGGILGKKRWRWTGDGMDTTRLLIPNGQAGPIFDLDLDFSGLRLADFQILGESVAALDLLTIRDFLDVCLSRMKLTMSGGNGLRALHGTNLYVDDVDISNCAGSFIHLGGFGPEDWVNVYRLSGLRCANAPAGIEALNGGIRLEQAHGGFVMSYVGELDAGGKGIVLDSCGNVTILQAFIEHGDEACVHFGSTGACHDIVIMHCPQLHNTLGLGVDASLGGLLHRNITVCHNTFVGYSNPANIRFNPGATETYAFFDNFSPTGQDSVGEWVEGHPNSVREVYKSDGKPLYVNGLAIENEDLTIDSPTGNNLVVQCLGTGPVELRSADATLLVGDGQLTMDGTIAHSGNGIGFHGVSPVTRPTITGSRGNNVALTNLLAFLASRGDIINSTTA